MVKRSHSSHNTDSARPDKKARTVGFSPNKIATAENASRVDENPPLQLLLEALKKGHKNSRVGDCIVYWMRMGDLRVSDNRALSFASARAQEGGVPLIVLFIISPQDYTAHDRSSRRIDFTLRNLSHIQNTLAELNIPVQIETVKVRQSVPARVLAFASDLKSKQLFANFEYEVDELRRDIKVCELAQDKGIQFQVFHNKYIIEPGVILTGQGKPPAVYSPYLKKWGPILNDNLACYLDGTGPPKKNEDSVKANETFGQLFESRVPEYVEGFKLADADRKHMETFWPAGEEHAQEVLKRFLETKSRKSQIALVSPLKEGAEHATSDSRVKQYHQNRDLADSDTTSRLSAYLSAGVISVRECVRANMKLQKAKKVDVSRDTGIGRWNQELAWRDFYANVLASWPRVSMGRPWLEKYDAVVWEPAHEKGEDGEYHDTLPLKAWKEGKTGYPIVDAGMRCLNEMGWVHNRLRMITAMFLTKHLMIDWRIGERYYMEKLIDGDLASNNGGWQWCASTGVDPCPYFRIFNPYSQSPKADPDGNYIRKFVPELAPLKGKDIYQPSKDSADALGYARPIVEHKMARERALHRLKNIGEK